MPLIPCLSLARSFTEQEWTFLNSTRFVLFACFVLLISIIFSQSYEPFHSLWDIIIHRPLDFSDRGSDRFVDLTFFSDSPWVQQFFRFSSFCHFLTLFVLLPPSFRVTKLRHCEGYCFVILYGPAHVSCEIWHETAHVPQLHYHIRSIRIWKLCLAVGKDWEVWRFCFLPLQQPNCVLL